MFPKRTCKMISRHLWDFAAERLPEAQAERVAQHLRECASCRERMQQAQEMVSAIRLDRQAALPDYPTVWPAIQSRLDALPQTIALAPARSLRPVLAWGGLALVAAVAGGSVALRSHHVPIPRQEESPTIGPVVRNVTSPNERHDTPVAANRKNTPVSHSPQQAFRPRLPAPNTPRTNVKTANTSFYKDEMAAINADPVPSLLQWTATPSQESATLQASVDSMIRTGDDFVTVSFPPVAGLGKQGVAAAVAAYRHDKEVMDARLAKRVSLNMKAIAFSDLCRQLREATGIALRARRGVADEKVTIFCKDLPLRSIMSQISHVFGYSWLRLGEDGTFEYELVQSMRSQLAEEEMRNRDYHAALLALDDAMGKRAAEEDKHKGHWGNSWGVLQLYHRFSPADFAALRDGQTLLFGPDASNPDRVLPEDLRLPILRSVAGPQRIGPHGELNAKEGEGTLVSEIPGAEARVSFHLAQTELGQVSLQEATGFLYPDPRGFMNGMGGEHGFGNPLATGRSPESEKPDNAKTNAALRKLPAFQKKISLEVKSSCHRKERAKTEEEIRRLPIEDQMDARHDPPAAHVTSADVWEAIYHKTGLPIIADSYTHLYDAEKIPTGPMPLFDVLCQTGDIMGFRWKKDGDFIQARRTTFFWDKLKEIPNRTLARWREEKERKKEVTFDMLLEMAALSDTQMDSLFVSQSIRHCDGLEEWGLFYADSGGWRDFYMMRRAVMRFMGNLPSTLRQHALEEKGLSVQDLSPGQQQELVHALEKLGFTLQAVLGSRLRIQYVPSGQYVWHPRGALFTSGDTKAALPLISGKTPEGTLAAAQKFDPPTTASHIQPTRGILVVTIISADGIYWSFGKPESM